MSFASFQNDVYLRGLLGEPPTLPFDWRAVQAAAEQVMSPGAVGYVSGGAGAEDTMRANREAFDRWRLVPRMLRGIPADRDLSTTLLGQTYPAPVMLGPVGVLSIVHEEAERAVARAAAGSAPGCTIDRTPTGARSTGAGIVVPSTVVPWSRLAGMPRSMRGTSRHRSKAARLAAMVSSAPAPPAT